MYGQAACTKYYEGTMLDKPNATQLPFRFRYLEPLYNQASKQLPSASSLNPAIWMPGAFNELKFLYYEHLNLIVEDPFLGFLKEMNLPFTQRCSFHQYAAYWKLLLAQFPLLESVVSVWTKDYINHVLLLQARLEKDFQKIQKRLGEKTGRIAHIDSGVSDLHNGQCVHIIAFENGSKIVYKPRSLQLDQTWREYLQSIAQKSNIGAFRVPWVMRGNGYGYEEFIEHKPVACEKDFSTYFYRCGFLLGIAYILQSTDLHGENLIACDNCPVLVDLETGIRVSISFLASGGEISCEAYTADSVLKTNLLPYLLGGRTIHAGNDAFTSRDPFLKNLPFDSLGTRSGEAYFQDILAGFRLAYNAVRQYGITEKFLHCHARFLIRNTSFYVNLIKWIYAYESITNPNVFKQRLNYLEQMYKSLDPDNRNTFYQKLLRKEKKEIKKGYIPRFTIGMDAPAVKTHGKALGTLLLEKENYLSEKDRQIQSKRILISLNCSIPADRLYLTCIRLWKQKQIPFKEVSDIMSRRVSYWEKKLQNEREPQGIVVSSENRRYYLTCLPWNMMEGIPGLLPALAAWHVISGDPKALHLFTFIARKLYDTLTKTDLNLYMPGFPEGLEGILHMTRLIRPILHSVWIDQIHALTADTLHRRAGTTMLSEEDHYCEKEFMSGMDGVAFPSFFRGEGGWLYTLLQKISKKEA